MDNDNPSEGTQLSGNEAGSNNEQSLEDRFSKYVSDEEPENEAPADDQEPEEHGQAEEESQAQAEQADQAADEEVDYEHDGRQYRLPKALADGIMRQQDYTRKTSELAQHRNALVAQQQASNQMMQLLAQAPETLSELHAAHKSLMEWQSLDPHNPEHVAPERLNEYLAAIGLAERKFQKAQAAHSQILQQKAQYDQAQTNQRVAQGMQQLQREIKYDAPMAQAMTKYANNLGIPAQRLIGLESDPAMVRILHDAWQYSKIKTANPQTKALPLNKTVIKPGSTPMQRTASEANNAQQMRKSLKQTGNANNAIGLFERYV